MNPEGPKGPESKKFEQATDLEVALFLMTHLEKPCEDAEGRNIRDFYIREAKRVIHTMKNEHAKKLLEDALRTYAV